LMCVSITNGQPTFVVRNPWGKNNNGEDGLADPNGYATLDYDQMVANFGSCFVASAPLSP
jgi:hypothetical protein